MDKSDTLEYFINKNMNTNFHKISYNNHITNIIIILKIYYVSIWWAVRDSNSRPSRCKRDALPTELTALKIYI